MGSVSVAPAVSSNVYDRLVRSVLPAEAMSLVTDGGMHVQHVAALYPVSATMASQALIERLHAISGFKSRAKVMAFMQHVAQAWVRHNLSRASIMTSFNVGPFVTPAGLRLDAVGMAVGSYHADTFNGSYRCLGRTVEVLGMWLAAGDKVFTAAQVVMLTRLADFWFAVLDFDGVPDRVW